MRKLVMDENAQYFILALYWFMSNPISGKNNKKKNYAQPSLKAYSFIVTLLPFFTFSAFHALGYVRNNIIPNVFPTAARTNGDAPATWQAKAQQGIKTWTDKYYSTAMRFVAHSEVTIIAPRLILGLFR